VCKIFIGTSDVESLPLNYTADPNDIVATATVKVDKKSNSIGIITMEDGVKKFYFNTATASNSNISSFNEISRMSGEYLVRSSKESLKLKDVLLESGASIIFKADDRRVYVDLSPKNLDKSSILNILCD